MAELQLENKQTLIDIAKRNQLAYLAVFGSYARGDAQPGSDIDLYIRFGRPVGLFDVLQLQHEIEDTLELPVDLIAEEAVHLYPFVREGMEKDLLVLYADEHQDHLDGDLKNRYPHIPWREIIALRNVVSHEYFQVRPELLWDVATQEVPALRRQIATVLREMNG